MSFNNLLAFYITSINQLRIGIEYQNCRKSFNT